MIINQLFASEKKIICPVVTYSGLRKGGSIADFCDIRDMNEKKMVTKIRVHIDRLSCALHTSTGSTRAL